MISATLKTCLQKNQARYELVQHPLSHSSRESARRAGIPPDRIAKSVILGDQQGNYLMAVLPASRQLSINKIRQVTHRNWQLANERDFQARFSDCESGAIPPVGSAWGMDTLIDSSVMSQKDLYFEAGDHEALVHISTDQYLGLMPGAQRSPISE